MNAEQLVKYCVRKKGAYIDFPFGEQPVCIKVRGKIFAEIYTDIDNFKITLKCEPLLADLYRQKYPNVVVRGYHCPAIQQPHRNTVYINKSVSDDEIFFMIEHSYDEVVKTFPKKIQKEILGELPTILT
jgi:predicted DNA-binding protein (MmcQ/YjbR family)